MHRQRAVAFDGDGEACIVQRIDQRSIDLQHRLSAGQHDIAMRGARPPAIGNRPRQCVCIGEFAAADAIGADEIGVAKAALRGGAVRLASAPQIAAGETAEHRPPPRLRALTLQREEDFLDRVGHRKTPA